MANLKYIAEYTDDTSIELLKLHGALSVRTANVLMRVGKFKNIGAIINLKPEAMLPLRNAGKHTIDETMEFIDLYKRTKTEVKKQKRFIYVDDLIAYCNKCADVVQGLADKIIGNIGHGESDISALGGCSFFLQQARLYRFDIPNIIECFIKENGNDRQD